MICAACKAGRHTSGNACPNCWPEISVSNEILWPNPDCRTCGGVEAGCKGGTHCFCQHRTDRSPVVPSSEVDLALTQAAELLTPMLLGPLADEGFVLGVGSSPCTCTEEEAWSGGGRGMFAIPPPAGCPAHGNEIRRLRAVAP